MFGKQKVVISSMLLRSSCDSFNLSRVLVLTVVWTRREGMGVPSYLGYTGTCRWTGYGSNHRRYPRIEQVTSQGERGREDHEGQLRLDKL